MRTHHRGETFFFRVVERFSVAIILAYFRQCRSIIIDDDDNIISEYTKAIIEENLFLCKRVLAISQ